MLFRMICRFLVAALLLSSVTVARAGIIGADQLSASAMSSRTAVMDVLARLLAGVLLCALGLLQGCALVVPQTAELMEQWPAALPERSELADVPFFADDGFLCGPSSLATTLRHAGAKVEPRDLVPEVYLP